MKQESQDKFHKIFSIILLFLWCSLIFYFSNQDGNISENNSGFIINILNSIINIFFKDIDITNSLVITFIVRKLAHMFLYFMLYLLCSYVASSYKIRKSILFSFIFCFLYATSDEIHQYFIAERSFRITDILIDMLGSFIGYFIIKLKHKHLNY